jgi:ketosteroid isomerase-like protein
MSNAEQNADVVRRGYAAFNAADLKTLTELMPENASWHTPGRSRIAGDHVGRDAVFAQFGRYGGETLGTFKADLKEVFGSDNGRVVAIHHNSGERNGSRDANRGPSPNVHAHQLRADPVADRLAVGREERCAEVTFCRERCERSVHPSSASTGLPSCCRRTMFRRPIRQSSGVPVAAGKLPPATPARND